MARDKAVTVLREIAAAFDRHDLEGIMVHFADDAIFEPPRGPEPWGQRFVGKEQIRSAFASRFSGIPDIRYRQDDHFTDGDRGASEWTLSGTTTDGQWIDVRGCDLWTFWDGQVVNKDSFWKDTVDRLTRLTTTTLQSRWRVHLRGAVMGVEENKALIRRFYEEVWAQGHVDFAQEVFADD